MIAKAYLLVVSLLYFGLAIWCSVSPATTSNKVGFDLRGGSGQSEFMTVYGGLEFGIALVFALSMFRDTTVNYGVLACVIIHASLVVFRSISLLIYQGLDPFTYRLAIGEWVVALAGLAVLLFAPYKS